MCSFTVTQTKIVKGHCVASRVRDQEKERIAGRNESEHRPRFCHLSQAFPFDLILAMQDNDPAKKMSFPRVKDSLSFWLYVVVFINNFLKI